MLRVDDRTWDPDSWRPLPVPAGWEIAYGTADDIRVCGAHPWQSDGLVFATGDGYGTAACAHSSFFIGNAQFLLLISINIYKIPTLLKLKLGRLGDTDCLVKKAKGVGTKYKHHDILLCRRA